MIEAAVAALARRLLLARTAERGDVDVVGVQSPVVVVGIPSLQNKVANARALALSCTQFARAACDRWLRRLTQIKAEVLAAPQH